MYKAEPNNNMFPFYLKPSNLLTAVYYFEQFESQMKGVHSF